MPFTPERESRARTAKKKPVRQRSFVIQKHTSSRLHYDLRLEIGGVMKSWALPKGPSMDPSVSRLAVEVQDHSKGYRDFEGTIPEGNYGAGNVIVWDSGTYESGNYDDAALLAGHARGRLTIIFRGQKIHGGFSLYRFRGKSQWLLRKRDDKYARADLEPTEDMHSVLSHRALTDEGEWVPDRTRRTATRKKRVA